MAAHRCVLGPRTSALPGLAARKEARPGSQASGEHEAVPVEGIRTLGISPPFFNQETTGAGGSRVMPPPPGRAPRGVPLGGRAPGQGADHDPPISRGPGAAAQQPGASGGQGGRERPPPRSWEGITELLSYSKLGVAEFAPARLSLWGSFLTHTHSGYGLATPCPGAGLHQAQRSRAHWCAVAGGTVLPGSHAAAAAGNPTTASTQVRGPAWERFPGW